MVREGRIVNYFRWMEQNRGGHATLVDGSAIFAAYDFASADKPL